MRDGWTSLGRAGRLAVVGLVAGGTVASGILLDRPWAADSPPPASAAGRAPAIAVIVSAATRQDLPVTRREVGWAEPVATVTIRARIDGVITDQVVRDGQEVKKGDLLFQIDDREIKATIAKDQAMLERDQATLTRTRADLARAQDLVARKVAPAQQVDQATADEKVAAANIAADQAVLDTDRIRLGYTRISAPIDGRLGTVRVTPGNLVHASDSSGDGLVTITQMRPLRVSFAVPERDLPALRGAQGAGPVPVRVYHHGDARTIATGDLTFIDSSVDQASGTVIARATMANEDGALWPGQYLDVQLELGIQAGATVVPLVAVQPGQDGSFVYVVGKDGAASVRKVALGETLGDHVQVRTGLEPGEDVVTDGQLRLRDGSRVTATRDAHLATTSADSLAASSGAGK